jgi:hypothetical protein
MAYCGHVRNGVVVLDDPAALPNGTLVKVTSMDGENKGEEPDAALNERLSRVLGTAKGLPPDAAQNVDHYIYGQPKRQ